jgi:restriction endonuclease Mrr
VAILFVLFGAIGAGFLLILLIAVGSPRPPPIDLKRASGGSPLVELDAEQLGKLVMTLLDHLGLEMDRAQGGKNEIVEIYAINPTPLTGGKVLIHCVLPPPDTGTITGPMIGSFIRAVRSAYVTKGLFFTTGTFTADARLAAEDAPIEIFDRDQLQAMIDRHLETA